MRISTVEFQTLKQYFDQNDVVGGAAFLDMIITTCIEDMFKETNSYNYHYIATDQTRGLVVGTDSSGERAFAIDPELLEQINQLETRLSQMSAANDILERRVAELEDMHTGKGEDHTPPIITSKEQYQALEGKIKNDEKVLVESAFDQAKVLF